MISVVLRQVRNEKGAVLPLVLLSVILLSSLAFTLATVTTSTRQLEERRLNTDEAAYLARAGLERTCAELLLNTADWTTLAPGSLYAAEPYANGLYDVDLVARDAVGATILVRAEVASSTRTLQFGLSRDNAATPPAWIRVERVDDLGLTALVD